MSRIRANKITNQLADGSPTVEKGLIIAGVTTVTTLDLNGDLDVDGHTFLDNVSIAGVTTVSSILDATNTPASIRVAQDIQHKRDADTKITFPAADTVSIETAGSERLRINQYGQVGINTSVGGQLAIAMDSSNTNPLATGFIALSLKNTNTTDNSSVCMDFNNSVGGIVGRFGAQFKDTSDKDTDLYFATRQDGGALSEKLRITSDGKIGINETSPDGMLHLKGGVPSIFLEDTDGTHGQAIIEQNGDILKIRQDAGNASSGTGSVIQFEVDAQAYAKVDTAFGLKADNTCKAWLCYRSEAGNEGIIDDFNVATVNDETTGTFGVNLEVNVHRHGNGWSQSIVFGCYNDGSRPLIASVGYAPSHGSNNPWWDVEDNFVRVQTQRSDNGTVLDAKVFNLAMFGDTGDLHPA